MPKETLVTPEAVFKAADRLVARGKNPSLRAVRRELGGGSFGTILPFLQSWRRARDPDDGRAEEEAGDPIPPTVAAALDKLIAAAAEVAESVQEAVNTPPARDEDDEDAEAANEKLRAEIASLQKMALDEIAALRAERDDLIGRLNEARRELGELKAWRERAVAHMKKISTQITD